MKKILTFIFAAALAWTAWAQEPVQKETMDKYPLNWFVGVGGGFNLSTDALRYSTEKVGKGTGVSLDIYGGKWLTSRFGVRLGYHGINTSFDDTKVDNDHGSHPFLYAHADAVFRPATWLVPYVHAGYINVTHRNAPGGSLRKSALGGGVGVMFPIRAKNLRIIPGIRLTMMNGDVTTYQDVNTKSLRYKLSATIGLAYSFGRQKPHVIREVVEKEVPVEVPVEVIRIDTVHIHSVDTVYIRQALDQMADSFNRRTQADVLFDLNSAKLRPDAYPILQEVVDFLKENPGVRARIEGHACTVGFDSVNLPLSERRAQAVYDYLQAHGIACGRLSARGYGSTRPKVSNDTEQGRRQNRRIEFVFEYDSTLP